MGGIGRSVSPLGLRRLPVSFCSHSSQDSYGFDILPSDSIEVQHSKVEKVIREDLQAEAQWQPNGGLLVVQTLPAVRRVASTGKATFFNGLMGVYGRSRDNGALKFPHKGKDGKYHIPSTFGDGEEIPFEVLERVLEIADEIGFLTPWEEGDVALIDNFTIAVSFGFLCWFSFLVSLRMQAHGFIACAVALGWRKVVVGEPLGWA